MNRTAAPLWIKICGLRSAADVAAAVASGADAVGFVFHAASPRHLDLQSAQALAATVPRGVEKVAVFLHPTQAELDAAIDAVQPDWVQTDATDLETLELHGGQRVLPVYRTDRALPTQAALPPRYLLESGRSGTGERADWDAAARLARHREVVLAGGLDAANVGYRHRSRAALRRRREFGRRAHARREGCSLDHEFRECGPCDARAARVVVAGVIAHMKTQALNLDREALLAQTLKGEFPDARGRFGPFGGRYVPETLVPALDRLEQGIRDILPDPAFKAELDQQLRTWVGRPTPLTYAAALSKRWGAEVWLKREDLEIDV